MATFPRLLARKVLPRVWQCAPTQSPNEIYVVDEESKDANSRPFLMDAFQFHPISLCINMLGSKTCYQFIRFYTHKPAEVFENSMASDNQPWHARRSPAIEPALSSGISKRPAVFDWALDILFIPEWIVLLPIQSASQCQKH